MDGEDVKMEGRGREVGGENKGGGEVEGVGRRDGENTPNSYQAIKEFTHFPTQFMNWTALHNMLVLPQSEQGLVQPNMPPSGTHCPKCSPILGNIRQHVGRP